MEARTDEDDKKGEIGKTVKQIMDALKTKTAGKMGDV